MITKCDLSATILFKLVDYRFQIRTVTLQKNQGDKSHHVIVALGSVTILLRFHLLFTRKR